MARDQGKCLRVAGGHGCGGTLTQTLTEGCDAACAFNWLFQKNKGKREDKFGSVLVWSAHATALATLLEV